MTKSAGSLVRDIFLSILTVVVVILVFFLVDISPWEPNRSESENLFGNLFELLPDGLFTETFAPYDMVEFNVVTALVVIGVGMSIVWQVLSWAFWKR
ncbi:YfzA family protein [Natribacillus halophilus]|uniref:YfzA-like protein n=1 Tax=Natribacillus halophilus TaxID=549003 RepID=A0A1G8SM89_9BACI|nr:YfzA family protein [Natribacillus halophilus]SDJ29730.1 YfzA-like protein [Natribacillus halophilus]